MKDLVASAVKMVNQRIEMPVAEREKIIRAVTAKVEAVQTRRLETAVAAEKASSLSQRSEQRVEAAKTHDLVGGSIQPNKSTRDHGQSLSQRLDVIEAQRSQQQATLSRENEFTAAK